MTSIVNFMGQTIEPGALVAFRSGGQNPSMRIGKVRSIKRKASCEWHFAPGNFPVLATLAPHIPAIGWNKTKVLLNGVLDRSYQGVYPCSSVDVDALVVIDQASWDFAANKAKISELAQQGDPGAVQEVLKWQ